MVSYGISKGVILFFPHPHPPCPWTLPPLVSPPHRRLCLPSLVGTPLSPILFYCIRCCLLFYLGLVHVLLGVPPCWFCSSTAERLIVATVYCGPASSSYVFPIWYIANSPFMDATLRLALTFLEPPLIPLWTPHRSSNHTIYTAPLTVSSL